MRCGQCSRCSRCTAARLTKHWHCSHLSPPWALSVHGSTTTWASSPTSCGRAYADVGQCLCFGSRRCLYNHPHPYLGIAESTLASFSLFATDRPCHLRTLTAVYADLRIIHSKFEGSCLFYTRVQSGSCIPLVPSCYLSLDMSVRLANK